MEPTAIETALSSGTDAESAESWKSLKDMLDADVADSNAAIATMKELLAHTPKPPEAPEAPETLQDGGAAPLRARLAELDEAVEAAAEAIDSAAARLHRPEPASKGSYSPLSALSERLALTSTDPQDGWMETSGFDPVHVTFLLESGLAELHPDDEGTGGGKQRIRKTCDSAAKS